MENIEFIKQSVKFKSFSGKEISKFLAVESEFVGCSFEKMKIKNICFGAGDKQSRYINCVFDDSEFSSNVPGIARFENCSFKNIKIKKFFCVDIEMINCRMSGEIIQGNFVGIHRDIDGSISVNEFRDNDFTNLKLGDVGFIGIDLTAQKLPVGSDFLVILNVEDFLTKVKAEIINIKDLGLSNSISNVISMIEMVNEGGNNQLFVDKRSFPKNLQDAVSVVFEIYAKQQKSMEKSMGINGVRLQ